MAESILGISYDYHDSAAALLVDGEIVAAAQEERFSRRKHDPRFPTQAIHWCLKEGGLRQNDLTMVVFYDKPFIKFDRILTTFMARAPRGLVPFLKAMPTWMQSKLWTRRNIRKAMDYQGPLFFSRHHESHAASAFYPSPFDEAAILTLDGVGEWDTSSLCVAEGPDLRMLRSIRFPHSLGLLYSAFTYYCGFKVNSGEYKLMGLAPYGDPQYADQIKEHLIELRDDGSYRLNMKHFGYLDGMTMTSPSFDQLFGAGPRRPESPISQREMDLAASIQQVVEEAVLRQARYARKITGKKNLCLAGGVALNCVANGKLIREGIFDQVWIQPAAGDAGGALGAAYHGWHRLLKRSRSVSTGSDRQQGSMLGPSYQQAEILDAVKQAGAKASTASDEKDLLKKVSTFLQEGKVIGWFQGRMEFGPRALGCRSIIGDARNQAMQSTMNLKIKFRESFRPFAPIVLKERASEFFELEGESPYMLVVAPVHASKRLSNQERINALQGLDRLKVPRSEIPAVTHVDYSARVQTLTEERNGITWRLLKQFEADTQCPVLVNTSFNVRGEPIVNLPSEAIRCFLRTHMDVLVMEDVILEKDKQDPSICKIEAVPDDLLD